VGENSLDALQALRDWDLAYRKESKRYHSSSPKPAGVYRSIWQRVRRPRFGRWILPGNSRRSGRRYGGSRGHVCFGFSPDKIRSGKFFRRLVTNRVGDGPPFGGASLGGYRG
jgi:hypothetical protein